MVAITKLLVLATAASALTLDKRATVPDVQNDLKTVNSDTQALTSKAQAYNGGTAAAIPVANAASKLDDDIKDTTSDANSAPAATSAQATSILTYIKQNIIPNSQAALNAIVAKKSQYTSAGLKSTVTNQIQTLRSDTASLASALIAKAPAAQKSSASAVAKSIDNLFSSALATFTP